MDLYFSVQKSAILLPKWIANQIEHLCHNNADIFKEDVPFLWTTSIISRGTRCRPSNLRNKKTNYQTQKIKESKRTKNKKTIIYYQTYYFFNVKMLKNGKEYCLSWKYLRKPKMNSKNFSYLLLNLNNISLRVLAKYTFYFIYFLYYFSKFQIIVLHK